MRRAGGQQPVPQVLNETVLSVKLWLDAQIKGKTWGDLQRSLEVLFKNKHSFEVAQGMGVGEDSISKFLGKNWPLSRIREALAGRTDQGQVVGRCAHPTIIGCAIQEPTSLRCNAEGRTGCWGGNNQACSAWCVVVVPPSLRLLVRDDQQGNPSPRTRGLKSTFTWRPLLRGRSSSTAAPSSRLPKVSRSIPKRFLA